MIYIKSFVVYRFKPTLTLQPNILRNLEYNKLKYTDICRWIIKWLCKTHVLLMSYQEIVQELTCEQSDILF